MNFSHLAAQLKVMRYRAGIDQQTMADLAGLGVKTVSSFETGQRTNTIKLRQLEQMAEAVGLTIQEALAIEPTEDEMYVLRLSPRATNFREPRYMRPNPSWRIA